MEDDHVDRLGVEVQQCMQLTSTNHPFDLIPPLRNEISNARRHSLIVHPRDWKFNQSLNNCINRQRKHFTWMSENGPPPEKKPISPSNAKALGGRHSNTTRTTTSGGHSREEPPGPIPNPEVKLLCADGSGTIGPVRVGRRQL